MFYKLFFTGLKEWRRSKSERSYRELSKELSITENPKTMLQNLQWKQYELIQETLLRTVSCEIKKCESTETLDKKVEEIKASFQNTVDKFNDKL